MPGLDCADLRAAGREHVDACVRVAAARRAVGVGEPRTGHRAGPARRAPTGWHWRPRSARRRARHVGAPTMPLTGSRCRPLEAHDRGLGEGTEPAADRTARAASAGAASPPRRASRSAGSGTSSTRPRACWTGRPGQPGPAVASGTVEGCGGERRNEQVPPGAAPVAGRAQDGGREVLRHTGPPTPAGSAVGFGRRIGRPPLGGFTPRTKGPWCTGPPLLPTSSQEGRPGRAGLGVVPGSPPTGDRRVRPTLTALGVIR